MDEEKGPIVHRDTMLFTMRISAHQQAQSRLSEEGKEVFNMLRTAERIFDPVDAFGEATAYDALSDKDRYVLWTYLSRITLINGFKDYVEEEEEDW